MAELKRLPTQAELEQILFMSGIRPQSTADIVSKNLAPQTIKSLPQNVFQKIAGGAGIAREAVNRLGNAADVAKLFPGYTGQTQVTIPTGFSFAPKQTPTGEVTPGGLQTQQVNVNELLKAIKPADVLGISGAERAYSDIGAGRAPKPMDVVDTLALGAGGVAGVKGAAKTGIAAGKYAAPEVGRMAEQYAIKTGLLSPLDAYHGSPYTFDAFDISKVGTGEGAQAYGHGIYFAEAPGVARGYQMALGQKAGDITTIGGKPIEQVYEQIYNKANRLPPDKAAVEYQKAEMLEKMMLDTPPADVISYAKDIGADPAVIKWLETDIAPKTKFPGAFYKVDIPDAAVETFLDWDKPLSEQPNGVKEVLLSEYKQEIESAKKLSQKYGDDFDVNSLTGRQIYTWFAQGRNPAETSKFMNDRGIQGIKYLDQNSRADGKGTRNFVVFDPSIVKMLERNDKPVK